MSDIRVMVTDDHPVVRRGISQLLEQAVGIIVIGEANDGEQTLEMVDNLKPDILILDMELPGIKGMQVAQELVARQSNTRILALSSYTDREYVMGALSNGANGYLTKDEVPDRLIEAVRGVARGERGWVSREVASMLSDVLDQDSPANQELTQRERETLTLVVAGKTNAEIGQILEISEKTVEKHLMNVYQKLEVSSRVEAAVLAVRNNLV